MTSFLVFVYNFLQNIHTQTSSMFGFKFKKFIYPAKVFLKYYTG